MKTRKCKYCKQPFEPIAFLQKNCFEPNCVAEWINETKQKEWKKRKEKMRIDLMTIQDYIKLAQTVFNKYIRLRDKLSPCISCQKKINGVEHASHYLSAGGHSNVRFHEDNVWTSCYKCNVILSGNQVEYRKQLINKIGVERVEWLEKNGSKEKKYSIEELKEIIKIYKQKIKQFET